MFSTKTDSSFRAELGRLAMHRAPSSVALDDFVADMGDGFSVLGESASAEFLPNGAPKDWSSFEKRAFGALTEAAERRSFDWAEREAQLTEDLTREGLDESRFDDTMGDTDDSRWLQAGATFGDNWVTIPAITQTQSDVADAARQREFDGQTREPDAGDDHLATLRLLREGAEAAYRANPSTRAARRYHGINAQVELGEFTRVRELFHEEGGGLVVSTSPDASAWRGHGTFARGRTFRNVAKCLIRAQTLLETKRAGAQQALAFLRSGFDLLEKQNRAGYIRRGKAVRQGDKTVAAGRDYVLTRKQMDTLRGWRRELLTRYSQYKLPEAVLREAGMGFVRSVISEGHTLPDHKSIGTRQAPAVETQGAVDTSQLVRGWRPGRLVGRGARTVTTKVQPISTPLSYRGQLNGAKCDFDIITEVSYESSERVPYDALPTKKLSAPSKPSRVRVKRPRRQPVVEYIKRRGV